MPDDISIRLTEDEEERLDGLARRTGRSKSFYVKTALHEYLTDLEGVFAADAAIDELETRVGVAVHYLRSRLRPAGDISWSVETTDQLDHDFKKLDRTIPRRVLANPWLAGRPPASGRPRSS